MIGKAVLLVGSAKPAGTSTSEAIGQYLLDRIAERGIATETLFVSRSAVGRDGPLMAALARADLFLLATPLYVDSLPYLVTRTLERIARARRPSRKPCAFAVVVNCGFPDAAQCAIALHIAQAFARRAGFMWAGGLALAEGGLINGQPLGSLGWFTKRVRAALELAAGDLAAGDPIPAAAVAQMGERLMPTRLYTMAGNIGWRRMAARNHVAADLDARPFDRDRG
jgi:hypothetical protein